MTFYQLDKDGVLLQYNGSVGSDYLTENSCRARRHECLYNHFSKKTGLVNIKKTIIGINLDNFTSNAKIEDVTKILNAFEDTVGISKTVIKKVSNFEYVFTGSYWWSIAPPVHSLYTLLIRFLTTSLIKDDFVIGDKECISKYGFSHGDYIEYENVCDKITLLMSNVREIFGNKKASNYTLDMDYNNNKAWAIHYAGIHSFLNGKDTSYFPKFTDKMNEWREKFKQILNNNK